MQTKRRPSANRPSASRSIHPRGTTGNKVNTTRPRRKPEATDAHRRHVAEHPTDTMSAARLAKLDGSKE